MLRGLDRVTAQWERTGTGHYQVELFTPDGVESLDFRIEPEKISQDSFTAMLDDLHQLPAEIAMALKNLGALEGLELRPASESTLAQQVHRLRKAVQGTASRPGLIDVLNALRNQPHRVLLTTEEWVQRHRARRPDPARLSLALVRSGNLDEDRRPVRVIDSRVDHTVDVYENRLLKWYLRAATLGLRYLLRYLSYPQHASLFAEVSGLLDNLATAERRTPFLDEVNLPNILDDRLSMVLLKLPAYRAMYEGWLEFLRSATVQLDDQAMETPLEELPHLYETWATLGLIRDVLDTASEMGLEVRRQQIIHKTRGGLVVRVLADGEPAVVLRHPGRDIRIEVTPQYTYRPGASGLRSTSHSQRPDLSIITTMPDNTSVVLLFDPKYKLDSEWDQDGEGDPRPKKVDIDKMHAYRDAIRGPGNRHVVAYAATLYPGPTVTYTSGLEALRAYPGEEPQGAPKVAELIREALA